MKLRDLSAGVLGRKVKGSRRELDTFELPTTAQETIYKSDEVTSNCPITGQPDWYFVSISLLGSRLGLESKSLKLYLQSFRDDGQFCEAFANTIAQDVSDATQAASVSVKVIQKPRGGVSIEATAVLQR
jgi:7-cyano-7-deazaguanine reductase